LPHIRLRAVGCLLLYSDLLVLLAIMIAGRMAGLLI
jgi:hypothetical protein